jgi:SAM-dependent methyltransferase
VAGTGVGTAPAAEPGIREGDMTQIDKTTMRSVGPQEPAQGDALAQLKQAARTTWALGDYAAVAERELWPLGERIVARAGIHPGEDVLDVGCGTGNAAIRAARAGGQVVGLDLTPELFEAGRRRAAEAGVDVDWVEGDAEALPFDDASFDVVVSVVGVMFAPRHQVAAAELVRVLRPGGRFVLCNWAHGSTISRLFGVMARYLPPPPPFAAPPALWGAEEHVRDLFAGTPVELQFERGVHQFPPFDSAETNIEYHTTTFGPLMAVRALTGADGRWPALRAELLTLHQAYVASEYLVTLGHKR